MMKILLAVISPRRPAPGPTADLVSLYIDRASRYLPTALKVFASEAALLDFVAGAVGRTRPALLLADSRGQQLSSEELAVSLGSFKDSGTQQVVLAIGPADGWSDAARASAVRSIAFGRITLPHELAAVVAAEQIYRALTIQAGHPYHSGH